MTCGEQLSGASTEKPTLLRGEWSELEAAPSYPDCPLVHSIDAAQTVIEAARKMGIISSEAAGEKIKVLNLRRLTVATAQEKFGCPRQNMGPEAIGAEEANFNCSLPVGRVDTLAFGNPDYTGGLLERDSKGTGFNA